MESIHLSIIFTYKEKRQEHLLKTTLSRFIYYIFQFYISLRFEQESLILENTFGLRVNSL